MDIFQIYAADLYENGVKSETFYHFLGESFSNMATLVKYLKGEGFKRVLTNDYCEEITCPNNNSSGIRRPLNKKELESLAIEYSLKK